MTLGDDVGLGLEECDDEAGWVEDGAYVGEGEELGGT